MNRTVSPELLDSLPADSSAAQHSRRDLRWFNRLLGNDRWWGKALAEHSLTGGGIEIGAGDGTLAQRHGLDALDLQSEPTGWPISQTWHTTDISAFGRWSDYPLVVANLFLHHLEAPKLKHIGAVWNDTAQTIIACEPWRARGFRFGFSLLCAAIQAHAVSRHDGRVSVEAGFRRDELPLSLGLDPAVWEWKITHTPLGMYRMIAQRKASY